MIQIILVNELEKRLAIFLLKSLKHQQSVYLRTKIKWNLVVVYCITIDV